MTAFERVTKDPETLAAFINTIICTCSDDDQDGCFECPLDIGGGCEMEDIIAMLTAEVPDNPHTPGEWRFATAMDDCDAMVDEYRDEQRKKKNPMIKVKVTEWDDGVNIHISSKEVPPDRLYDLVKAMAPELEDVGE